MRAFARFVQLCSRPHLEHGPLLVDKLHARTAWQNNEGKAKIKGSEWTLNAWKNTAHYQLEDYEESLSEFMKEDMTPTAFIKITAQQKHFRVAWHVIMTPGFITHPSQRMIPSYQRERSRCRDVFLRYYVCFCVQSTGTFPLPPLHIVGTLENVRKLLTLAPQNKFVWDNAGGWKWTPDNLHPTKPVSVS